MIVLIVILVRRGHFAIDAPLGRRLPRMLGASAVMVAVLWALRETLFASLDTGSGFGLRWLGLGLLVGGGLAAYGLAGQVFGAFDVREVAMRLRPRRRAAVRG